VGSPFRRPQAEKPVPFGTPLDPNAGSDSLSELPRHEDVCCVAPRAHIPVHLPMGVSLDPGAFCELLVVRIGTDFVGNTIWSGEFAILNCVALPPGARFKGPRASKRADCEERPGLNLLVWRSKWEQAINLLKGQHTTPRC
jgi:hypothetical protein